MLLKGRDLWVFVPSVSQPIRLPLSQRLTGLVANGDLARANFAGDYAPKLLKTETVDGVELWQLELTAVDRSVPYARVLYWVETKSYRPYRAEFYGTSGKLLKTSRFERFEPMLGTERPTRMVMEDSLRSGERSVLDYRQMETRDLPDKMFTKDYLKRVP
jgi:hypothetical protein